MGLTLVITAGAAFSPLLGVAPDSDVFRAAALPPPFVRGRATTGI